MAVSDSDILRFCTTIRLGCVFVVAVATRTDTAADTAIEHASASLTRAWAAIYTTLNVADGYRPERQQSQARPSAHIRAGPLLFFRVQHELRFEALGQESIASRLHGQLVLWRALR